MLYFLYQAASPLEAEDQRLILGIYQENYALMRWQIKAVTTDLDYRDDILQDSFLRLIRNVERLRTLNTAQRRVYAVTTSKTAAIDYMRRKHRRDRWSYYPEETLELPDSDELPEETAIRLEEQASLHSAIALLPELERDLIAYRYFLGLSCEEICRITGIRKSGYYQRFTLMKKHLRKLLEKGGWEP